MATQLIIDETTAKVANLIKIKIPNEELPKYTSQLNTVLESVDVLQEVDTKDTPITAQTHGLTNVLREDEVKPGLDMTNYKNTKNFRKPNFIVKKVL